MTARSLGKLSTLVLFGALLAAPALHAEAEDPGPAPDSPFEDLGLRWYEEAFRAYQRGDLEAARNALEQAVEHGADPQLVALQLGYWNKEGRDLDLARQWFERALEGDAAAVSSQAGEHLTRIALLDIDRSLADSERFYWLREAERARDLHLWDLARQAYERALEAGADPQLVSLELGWIALSEGRQDEARSRFEEASDGPDERWAAIAKREVDTASGAVRSGGTWQVSMQQGWMAKQRGQCDVARQAFSQAGDMGADPQRLSLELAYLEAACRDRAAARRHLEVAAAGPDPDLASQAQRELGAMSRRAARPAPEPETQPWFWFERAWEARDAGDYHAARQALMTAADLGADPQQHAMEMGYVLLLLEEPEAAVERFEAAVVGDDPEIAERAKAQLLAMAGEQSDPDAPADTTKPAYWMKKGWSEREAGDLAKAREAFFYAREMGAPQQVVAMELAYVAMADGDVGLALLYFEEASLGVDPELAQRAADELAAATPPEPGENTFDPASPEYWLQEGWRLAGELDHAGARRAFLTAAELGANGQLVSLELGYNAMARGDKHEAFAYFREAAQGPDPKRAAQAEAELEYLDGPLWGDIYGDTYGWWRLSPQRRLDLIPMLRARAYWTPFGQLDLHAYAFLQASRDMASRSAGASGYPEIYADNSLMFGPGALARFLGRRVGVYAQIGPALNLVDDGSQRWELDARVAAYLGLEGGPCWPGALERGEWGRGPSGLWRDLYAETVYVSRFDHNVVAMARGRAGISPLVSGRVAWQPMLQARAFGDLNGDYWNNRADIGAAHRWRWQTEVPLDLLLGFNVGSYYGRENLDSAPNPLVFTELWLQAVTYYQF